ncbi:hypothetical protein [Parabacteroides pacaensis]|uniref:hypothetical protein n=1 Tax=Parabacteroides pacaensis TaxID=2086575 RepID=UPI000D1026DA|nr:hypothetical protein [Parabacteroides pacaensis]
MMIQQITQRLSGINTFLTTCKQEDFSFGQALPLSLFYRDFSDTNSLVGEATELAKENPEELLELSSSLISESDKYLSLDKSVLQTVDFKTVFEEHLKPFKDKYEETKVTATKLWQAYSAMSNRLDFVPLDSEEYTKLSAECDTKKAEYDTAHAQTGHLYKEWQQERDRYFCVYCFRPMFLDVLVERLKGIAQSIIADISRMKEDKP